MKEIFVGVSLFFASLTWAGHGENNGGDHIRATFIKSGQAIVRYLTTTENGLDLLMTHGLDAKALLSVLSIDVITVEPGPLLDNGGSIVDALGMPGQIQLDGDKWFEHFEHDRDVYYLVFHEMLRALGINDDNYILSRALTPFPASQRIVTHVGNRYPLIEGDLLLPLVQIEQIAFGGSGCPQSDLGFFADFDLERNQLDLFPKQFTLRLDALQTTLARKSCSIAIPVLLPAGRRLVIAQVDLSTKLDLPAALSLQVGYDAFIAGSSSLANRRDVKTEFDRSVPLQGRLLIRKNDLLKSRCGGAETLRLNSSAVVRYLATSEEERTRILQTQGPAMVAVDRITLSFRVESCDE